MDSDKLLRGPSTRRSIFVAVIDPSINADRNKLFIKWAIVPERSVDISLKENKDININVCLRVQFRFLDDEQSGEVRSNDQFLEELMAI
jgi:S-adenosylmethionine hydrolase